MEIKTKVVVDVYKQMIAEADYVYTKEQLQSGWYTFAIKFFSLNVNKIWGDVSAQDALRIANSKKNPVKADMLKVGLLVLKNEVIFNEFLRSLPPYLRTLLEKLTWEKSVDRKTAEALTKSHLLDKSIDKWMGPHLKKEFHLFQYTVTGYSYYNDKQDNMSVFLTLPLGIRQVISNYLPKPDGYEIKPIPKPDNENILYFNAEESINRELPILLAYYLQDQIKYSERGRPYLSAIKRIPQKLQLKEFFAEGIFPATRSLLMAGMVWGYKQIGNPIISDIIKELFRRNFLAYSPAGYMYSSIKGLNNFSPIEFKAKATANIWLTFAHLPENEWVSIANLHTYCETHFIDFAPIEEWKLANKASFEDPATEEKCYITHDNYSDFVYLPFLAGSAFIFASFGLLELSYKKTRDNGFATTWFSEYDGLAAVKLTALGAYVLGLRKDYQRPISISEDNLVLEKDSLIIRAEGNIELAQVQLNNFAQKVSGNRYQFSPALFLKDCKKKTDVVNKISLFKQSIGKELPPNWEAYLNKLVTNSKLIQKETKMTVFKLPPEDKELQRLIVQDDVLKKIVIKAEHFHILVDSKNEAAFRVRLKEVGILLE